MVKPDGGAVEMLYQTGGVGIDKKLISALINRAELRSLRTGNTQKTGTAAPPVDESFYDEAPAQSFKPL